MKKEILFKRGFILAGKRPESLENIAYFNAKILETWGVILDKPELISKSVIKVLEENLAEAKVPNSFYNNPQDLVHFTSDELLIEQIISYFKIMIEGQHSTDDSTFERPEIFNKALPNYEEGQEVHIRTYKVITEDEANVILNKIGEDLKTYTRGWSVPEFAEFIWLVEEDYIEVSKLSSKDNTITIINNRNKLLLGHDYNTKLANLAKGLDKVDVVKMSVLLNGESSKLVISEENKKLLTVLAENAYDVPMSAKNAKFYNTLIKKLGLKQPKKNNNNSPLKLAGELIKTSRIDAAKELSKHGSLLNRHLMWLLSRATFKEVGPILDLVEIKNPIVAIQLIQTLTSDDNKSRSFKFTKNGLVRNHTETEYETKWRKSRINSGNKELIREHLLEKVKDFYRDLPSLGKIYISDEFKKIAVPTNTSATGDGVDILPSGSRLPITSDYIRAFVRWKGVHDIDSSIIFKKEDGSDERMYFGSYNTKPFGNSALVSGDDRSKNGVEYMDFKLSELRDKGFTHGVYILNGYGGSLDQGEIYTGYQHKEDLNTKAWKPNNIAVRINVKFKSRSYVAFGIDLINNEMVVINQGNDSNSLVFRGSDLTSNDNIMNPDFLKNFNMHMILSSRGEVVDTPEEADVVFDSKYISETNQEVVKPSSIEKLVKLIN